MKHRSAPLDNTFQELQFVLQPDGGPLARTLLRLFSSLYRGQCRLMLLVLRFRRGTRPGRRLALMTPPVGQARMVQGGANRH